MNPRDLFVLGVTVLLLLAFVALTLRQYGKFMSERDASLPAKTCAEHLAVAREAARLSEILEATPDFIFTINLQGEMLWCNHALRQHLDLTDCDIVSGLPLSRLYPPRMVRLLRLEAFPEVLRTGHWQAETVVLKPGGGETPVSQVLVAHRDGSGEVLYISAIVRNITAAKTYEMELKEANARLEENIEVLDRLASRDALTGLLNRRILLDRLQTELLRAERYGSSLCVVMVDLDHFKSVNDTFGHAVGDSTLKAAAGLLSTAAREYDILARYGGEEFVLVLPETDLEAGEIVAERVRRLFEEHNWPLRPVTISAGVAARTPRTLGADSLLAEADKALYQAKTAGRNRISVFQVEQAPMASAHVRTTP